MTIKGLNNDSILYQEQSLSSFNLPLHALQSTSAFVLQRGVLEPDTIVISHENVNQFISLECGCFVYHTIKSTATKVEYALSSGIFCFAYYIMFLSDHVGSIIISSNS